MKGFSRSNKNRMGSNVHTNREAYMVGEQYSSVGGGAPWRHIFRGVVDPTNVTMRCCTVKNVRQPEKWGPGQTPGYSRPSYPSMRMFA